MTDDTIRITAGEVEITIRLELHPLKQKRSLIMADISSVALQTSSEPTNKLAAGAQAAAGASAVLASVMAAYGADAITEALTAAGLGAYPAVIKLAVMAITGVAGWWAAKKAALMAGYNVLDRPNVPLATAPSPTLPPNSGA